MSRKPSEASMPFSLLHSGEVKAKGMSFKSLPNSFAMPAKIPEERVLSMHSPTCQTGGRSGERKFRSDSPAFGSPSFMLQ